MSDMIIQYNVIREYVQITKLHALEAVGWEYMPDQAYRNLQSRYSSDIHVAQIKKKKTKTHVGLFIGTLPNHLYAYTW